MPKAETLVDGRPHVYAGPLYPGTPPHRVRRPEVRDRLLVALRVAHGPTPRYDIAAPLLADHKGYAGKYHRKPLERS